MPELTVSFAARANAGVRHDAVARPHVETLADGSK